MSIEKIQELRDAMQQSLDGLPDQNAFSDSNANDRRLTQKWLADLNRVLDGQEPQTDAVISWLSGNDDYFLSDFLS